jgi:UDP-glucose 4-epimerase
VKAFVSGATGFIGSALVAELLLRGWEVECLARRPPASPLPPRLSYRHADLLEPDGAAAALRAGGPATALFHLAAALPTQQPPPDLQTYTRVNETAALRLFEAAADLGVARVVFASSVTVIGEPVERPILESHPAAPTSPYAASKLGGERHAERLRLTRGLELASLRIASCYGPGMDEGSVLPRFARAALAGQPLAWFGDGSRTQNFVHVRDVVRALLLAAGGTAAGVFNITGPESIGMRALAALMISLAPGSASVARAAGIADPQQDQRWEFDAGKAATMLGYTPAIGLRAGLTDYLDALRGAGTGHDARRAHLGHSR